MILDTLGSEAQARNTTQSCYLYIKVLANCVPFIHLSIYHLMPEEVCIPFFRLFGWWQLLYVATRKFDEKEIYMA